MTLHEVEVEDYVRILKNSKILTGWVTDGMTVHVVEHAGRDTVIVSNSISGQALVIEDHGLDADDSIHEHVRHAQRIGTF